MCGSKPPKPKPPPAPVVPAPAVEADKQAEAMTDDARKRAAAAGMQSTAGKAGLLGVSGQAVTAKKKLLGG